MILTENQLDTWARGNSVTAQATIVELVWRLICASAPRPHDRHIALPDSQHQPGPDVTLQVDSGYKPFIPEGISHWDIGTGIDPHKKATADFRERTRLTPKGVRKTTTFVFVTPLSGRTTWKNTWKYRGKLKWVKERRESKKWRDVRVIDGAKLVDWIHKFPAIEFWLAKTVLGTPITQLDTPDNHWSLTRSIGDPPPLGPELFLINRDDACAKLKSVFDDAIIHLKLQTRFPEAIVYFVSAYLATLTDDERLERAGRCLIVSGEEAWSAISAFPDKHYLIADASLDLNGTNGTRLIQAARRNGHAVVYGGPPGGVPDPTTTTLPPPNVAQVRGVLEKFGYREERARVLAQRSGGNVSSLLRCLQGLSLLPEWASDSAASELAIANALGSWHEPSEGDRSMVEALSGKAYGEWIEIIRESASRRYTPLIHRNGLWKFLPRYEGWYALGERLHDEHLDRLLNAVTEVFGEVDPRFDFDDHDSFSASLAGRKPRYSPELRTALADGLALLGSHTRALSSVSDGKAESIATLAVRRILSPSDWKLWATIDGQLPDLAEASPQEFLNAMERALALEESPYPQLFRSESTGVFSRSYIAGTLWALETLAWSGELLSRVILVLGQLAAIDPGGTYANRPARSLTTILLPWFPQTTAPIDDRVSAVQSLIREEPVVGWQLLLTLLPGEHTVTSGTRRPAWRDYIPATWVPTPSSADFVNQTRRYCDLALAVAGTDAERLGALIDRYDHLMPEVRDRLKSTLLSEDVRCLPESMRALLWTKISSLIGRHRKFHDAHWAMDSVTLNELDTIAIELQPTEPLLRYKRLFSDREFDLFQEKGNFNEQRVALEESRREAVSLIAEQTGIQGVIELARQVESPWRVGVALGAIAGEMYDPEVLPSLLLATEHSVARAAEAYIWGRFGAKGWSWAKALSLTGWENRAIGIFLSQLPFAAETWAFARQVLPIDQSPYWSVVSPQPYGLGADLEFAIEELLRHDRPIAALQCAYAMHHLSNLPSSALVARVLMAVVRSSEEPRGNMSYELIELIKSLQNDASADPEDLFRVEWAYMPILDGLHDASPKTLESRLACDPQFYCEIIRLVYRSDRQSGTNVNLTDAQSAVATNAYRLLHGWTTPPGFENGTNFSGERLNRWLDVVRAECTRTGHLRPAMSTVGHVLSHAPPDPDGLWIHHAVATVLNRKDAAEMRAGFRAELYNSRGVHWVDPSGAPEKDLASKYLGQARELDTAGFPRLASTLRELSAEYEHEAQRVISSNLPDG